MKLTAKEVIVENLIGKGYLSIKQIEELIKSNYNKEFSYHSIYKAIQQLIEEEKAIKKNSKYTLSQEWVKKEIQFADKLKKHLPLDFETSIALKFYSLKELHTFIKKFEKEKVNLFNENIKGKAIFVTNHCYNYLLQPAKELQHLKSIISANNELIVLCHGNTTLDKWTKKAYEKRNIKIVTDAGLGGIVALNIYDNHVIQIFYGKKFLEALEETFLKTKNISELDVAELCDNIEEIDYQINVSIHDDPAIISSIKERALITYERKKTE